jgi:hypothetical protein
VCICDAQVEVVDHQGWLLTEPADPDRFWQAPGSSGPGQALPERTTLMLRSSMSRRFLGLAIALSAGTGIGVGAASAWSAWGANAPLAPRPASAVLADPAPGSSGPATPAPPAPPAASGLTLDQAKAVATQVAPGRVVEAHQDVEGQDSEDGAAQETTEPTGLVYDVTVLHDDGTVTEVEIDAATGRVLSTETDDHWDGH